MSLRNHNVFNALPQDSSLIPNVEKGSHETHSIANLDKPLLKIFYNFLVQYDINTAHQLSLTCRAFNYLFQYLQVEYIDKLAANYLLQALINASVYSRQLRKYVTTVINIRDDDPFAIFTEATAKGLDGQVVQCSPLAYVFANQDAAFQDLFYESSKRVGMLELFVQVGEETSINDVNADYVAQAYFAFLEACGKPENESYTEEEISALNELFCKLIIPVQSKLPRRILDRFLDFDQIWDENRVPTERNMPYYDIYDNLGVRGKDSSMQFNLCDESEEKTFGKDYGLTRVELSGGKSEPVITNTFETYDIHLKEYMMLSSFFNNSENGQRAFLARVKQELETSKANTVAL